MLVFGVKIVSYTYTWFYIDDALQGSVRGLRCPFCERSVVARKATKDKPPHFTHRKRACKYVRILRRLIYNLPIADYWLYGLPPPEQRLFKRLFRKRKLMDEDRFISYHTETSTVLLLGKEHLIYGIEKLGRSKYEIVEKLREWRLIKIYNFSFGVDIFQLTWKTQALWAKDWTLKKYYQEVTEYWKEWWRRFRWDDWTVDQLFNAMDRRIKEAYLYVLKITLPDQTLYKIGTTILSYEKLEKWERKNLKGSGRRISIEKIYYVDSITLIEPFIRIKYKRYIHSIKGQSGYFNFKKKAADFLADLHQVTLLSKQHKERIREGLKKAQNVGKRGKETIADFLAKPKSQAVISILEDPATNLSLRSIAFYAECSVNTVRKVKRLWEANQNQDIE